MQTQLKQEGYEEVNSLFQRLSHIDEQNLLEVVARPVKNDTRRAFETETDPWGKPWVNQDSKTYNHLDSASHVMQGSLYSVITGKVANVGVTAVSDTGYLYPAVHQYGSKKKSGRGSNIPKRAFFPIDENENLAPETNKKIDKALDGFIDGVLR